MSQIFAVGPTFNFLCKKTGNFFIIIFIIFSTFNKKRMRTCMKNLRHCFLHSNVLSMYQRFQAYNVHSKGDIHLQNIKVKKIHFRI